MTETEDVERVRLTPKGEQLARQAERIAFARQLAEQVRLVRLKLLDLPPAVREQLRVECIALADAAHELERLVKGGER